MNYKINHIFTTLLVIAFAFLFGSNAQAQKYDKAGIKAAIVNAGVPENEVTQDMVDKYYNFCLESMDNEDKFEKEILPKLPKPYVVKELLNAGFPPCMIYDDTWQNLKQTLEREQFLQSLSEQERKELWQGVLLRQSNLTPEEIEQKNTARLAELQKEMPELQAFFSTYAEKYADTAAKQKTFREFKSDDGKYRNPDFSAYIDFFNENRASKGKKEITEFSKKDIDDFLHFLDMCGFNTINTNGDSRIDFRSADGTWKYFRMDSDYPGGVMTKAQAVAELEKLYNSYKEAVFAKYDVRERGNIIRFKLGDRNITVENGKIMKLEPSSLPATNCGFAIHALKGQACLKYMNATDAKYMAEYLKNFPGSWDSRYPEEIRLDSLGHIYFVPYGKVGKIVFDKEIQLWPMILNTLCVNGIENDLEWLSKYIGGELADVKEGKIPEGATPTFVFDDGKQYPLKIYNTLIFTTYAPSVLIAANNKVEDAENARSEARQQAINNELINKCRANDYMGQPYSNILWLIRNGYIVKGDGFRKYVSNGQLYMTLRNKWGKVRNVRFDGNGSASRYDKVIDQW